MQIEYYYYVCRERFVDFCRLLSPFVAFCRLLSPLSTFFDPMISRVFPLWSLFGIWISDFRVLDFEEGGAAELGGWSRVDGETDLAGGVGRGKLREIATPLGRLRYLAACPLKH